MIYGFPVPTLLGVLHPEAKFHVEYKNGVRLIQTAVFRKLLRIYGFPVFSTSQSSYVPEFICPRVHMSSLLSFKTERSDGYTLVRVSVCVCLCLSMSVSVRSSTFFRSRFLEMNFFSKIISKKLKKLKKVDLGRKCRKS